MKFTAYTQKSDTSIRLDAEQMRDETEAHLNATLPKTNLFPHIDSGYIMRMVDPTEFNLRVVALVEAEFEVHEFDTLDALDEYIDAGAKAEA